MNIVESLRENLVKIRQGKKSQDRVEALLMEIHQFPLKTTAFSSDRILLKIFQENKND